jgi:hypothetical protein
LNEEAIKKLEETIESRIKDRQKTNISFIILKIDEEILKLESDIITRKLEQKSLGIDILNNSKERMQIESDYNKLLEQKITSEEKSLELEKKKTEEKNKSINISDQEVESRLEEEEESIRKKYELERKIAYKKDELEIFKIRLQHANNIIDNEKIGDKQRKKAYDERLFILEKISEIELESLLLDKHSLNNQIHLINLLISRNKILMGSESISKKEKKDLEEQNKALDNQIELLEKKGEIIDENFSLTGTQLNRDKSEPFVPKQEVTAFSDWFNPEAWAKPMEALNANMGQLTQQTADMIMTIMQSNLSAQQQMVDSYIQNQELLAEKSNKSLDNLLKHNLITQTQYEKKKEKIEEEKNNKIKSIKQAQFRKEQDAAVTQAVIQGALAIVQAYGQLGPIAGTVAAVLIALVTAAQIDTIASQPVPTYAKGGEIRGPSHTEGGVKVPTPSGQVELEGGEFVINKTITQKSGIKSLLQTINDGKLSEKNMRIIEMVTNNNTQKLSSTGGYMFQMGGQIPYKTEYRPISDNLMNNVNTSSTNTTIINNTMDVEELKSVIREVTSIPVYVSEVDISSTQRKVKVTQDKANW